MTSTTRVTDGDLLDGFRFDSSAGPQLTAREFLLRLFTNLWVEGTDEELDDTGPDMLTRLLAFVDGVTGVKHDWMPVPKAEATRRNQKVYRMVDPVELDSAWQRARGLLDQGIGGWAPACTCSVEEWVTGSGVVCKSPEFRWDPECPFHPVHPAR